jgi:hypothetical protein
MNVVADRAPPFFHFGLSPFFKNNDGFTKVFTSLDVSREESPSAGASFFAPDRLRIYPLLSLKIYKPGRPQSSLNFSVNAQCRFKNFPRPWTFLEVFLRTAAREQAVTVIFSEVT